MGQFQFDTLNSNIFHARMRHPSNIDISFLFSDKGIYVVSYITGKTINKESLHVEKKGGLVKVIDREPQYTEEKKRVVYAPQRRAALFLQSDVPQTIYDKPDFLNAKLDPEEITLLEKILLRNQNLEYCHYSHTGNPNKLQLHGVREFKACEIIVDRIRADNIVHDMLETQLNLSFWYQKLNAAHRARKSARNGLTEGMVKTAESGMSSNNQFYKKRAEQIVEIVTKYNKCTM